MNTLKNFNKLIDSHIHDIPGISKKFVKAPFKQSVRCLNIYPENRHQSNMPYYEIAFNENDTPKTRYLITMYEFNIFTVIPTIITKA